MSNHIKSNYVTHNYYWVIKTFFKQFCNVSNCVLMWGTCIWLTGCSSKLDFEIFNKQSKVITSYTFKSEAHPFTIQNKKKSLETYHEHWKVCRRHGWLVKTNLQNSRPHCKHSLYLMPKVTFYVYDTQHIIKWSGRNTFKSFYLLSYYLIDMLVNNKHKYLDIQVQYARYVLKFPRLSLDN